MKKNGVLKYFKVRDEYFFFLVLLAENIVDKFLSESIVGKEVEWSMKNLNFQLTRS